MIIITKIYKYIYTNDYDYHVASIRDFGKAVFYCKEPPKSLKTVQYNLYGEWENHKNYGKQFIVKKWEKFKPMDKINERSIVNAAKKML